MIFIGGQIQKEKRGNLALILAKEGSNEIGAFLEKIGSEDYYIITGTSSAVDAPILRAYVGVNHDAGKDVFQMISAFREQNITMKDRDLSDIDDCLVYPHFLRRE